MSIRQIHAQNRCALALAVAIPLRFFNWDLRANAGRGICMSIGRDFAAVGIEDSQRAYVKIQKDAKALRCWGGAQDGEYAVAGTRHSPPNRASAGRYHRFVSIAAVIPSLVEPIRARSLL